MGSLRDHNRRTPEERIERHLREGRCIKCNNIIAKELLRWDATCWRCEATRNWKEMDEALRDANTVVIKMGEE